MAYFHRYHSDSCLLLGVLPSLLCPGGRRITPPLLSSPETSPIRDVWKERRFTLESELMSPPLEIQCRDPPVLWRSRCRSFHRPQRLRRCTYRSQPPGRTSTDRDFCSKRSVYYTANCLTSPPWNQKQSRRCRILL